MSVENRDGVIRTIGSEAGWVNVEVDDLHGRTLSDAPQTPSPVERQYKYVHFLENGYLMCETPAEIAESRGMEKAERCLEYYPPDRVNIITAVDEEASALAHPSP